MKPSRLRTLIVLVLTAVAVSLFATSSPVPNQVLAQEGLHMIAPDQFEVGSLITYQQRLFHAHRPGSPGSLSNRDLELHWSYNFSDSGLTTTDASTLRRFGITLAETWDNPFGASASDLELIHDFFDTSGTLYSRDDEFGFQIGNPDMTDSMQGHIDTYLYRPVYDSYQGGNIRYGSFPSVFYSTAEDSLTSHGWEWFSLNIERFHSNSLMLAGPDSGFDDPQGTGWTRQGGEANYVFNHELQHAVIGGGETAMNELFSCAAEVISDTIPGPPALEIMYTWPLLSFAPNCPTTPCDSVGLNYALYNYPNMRTFAAYLAFNFRGADTLAVIPDNPSDTTTGFGDDLLWKWGRAGVANRKLRYLESLLSDSRCPTCADYFSPWGGDSLSGHDRLQLLLQNWRVAAYVNSPDEMDGRYGYPRQFGFSPSEDLGAWQRIDGLTWNDRASVPPVVTAALSWAVAETTLVGTRTDATGLPYAMSLMPLGAEYWVVRSDPSLGTGARDLAIRINAEGLHRQVGGRNCSQIHDGRLMASVIGYTDQADNLWAHPEWAAWEGKAQWVDVDSIGGDLRFTVPSFGTTHKAALIAISLADGPSGTYSSDGQVAGSQVLPYRVSLSLRAAGGSIDQEPLVQTEGTDDDAPTWAPSSDAVAFVKTPESGYSQVFIKTIGQGETQLRLNQHNQLAPDWSPRGDWLAFAEDTSMGGSGTAQHIWLKHPSTSVVRRLTSGGIEDWTPVFQPNGQGLAYFRHDGASGSWVLRHVNLDGTSDVVLDSLGPGAHPGSPRWTPDGQWIYFTRDSLLYAVPSTGGEMVSREDLIPRVFSFDWARGSGSVVIEDPSGVPYSAIQNCSPGVLPCRRIALVDTLAGDKRERFYRTGAEYYNPRWSYDGTQLVYSTKQDSAYGRDLWVGSVSGNRPPVFLHLPADTVVSPGQSFVLSLAATDADGDDISCEGAYLPGGSSINETEFIWSNPPTDTTTHYVVFRAKDATGGVAQKVVKLTMLPVRVTDLTPRAGKTVVAFEWTEPGQVGSNADEYDLRRSTTQITDANFSSATALSGEPAPGPGSTTHCYDATGLTCGQTYYFAMKTRDRDLLSRISNAVSATTNCSGPNYFCYEEGLMAGGDGGGGEEAVSQGLREASAVQVARAEGERASWENSLLWGPPETGVVDLYKLGSLVVQDSLYSVQLREAGSRHAALDRLSLGTVDHDPGVVAIAGEDRAYLGTMMSVVSATDGAQTDVLSRLASSPYEGQPGQVVTVRLSAESDNPALVVEAQGLIGVANPESLGILVQKPGPDASWMTIATIHPRQNFDQTAVSAEGATTLRLVFLRKYYIRSLGQLAVSRMASPQPLTLAKAEHSRLGSVADAVSASDGDSTSLAPADTLTLGFTATEVPFGLVRDLFLQASGGYRSPEKTSASQQLGTASGSGVVAAPVWQFSLGPARPNPSLGSVTIGYSLAQESPVSIRLYNVAGKLVKTLVSGSGEAGPHEVVWDARDDGGRSVPAGVYFYKMMAGSWGSQRKVVFLER